MPLNFYLDHEEGGMGLESIKFKGIGRGWGGVNDIFYFFILFNLV